jgi:AcrR family transcriptional regulator
MEEGDMEAKEKLSRREREKLWQRRQMLDAAIELFSQRGYHNVSMHQIAERSEFAIGTLYKFFKNKEDLYRALVTEKSTEIFGALAEPLSKGGDTLTVLGKYLENRAKIVAEVAPLIRMHMAVAQGMSVNINAEVEKEHRRFHEKHMVQLAAVMKEGIRRKVLRGLEPGSLAVALDGLARAFFQQAVKNPKRFHKETVAPFVLDLFLKGSQSPRQGRLPNAS